MSEYSYNLKNYFKSDWICSLLWNIEGFFIWLSQSWCQDSIPLTLLGVQTIELPDGAGVGKDTLSGPAQPQSSLLGRFSCQSRSSPERNKGILHGDYFPEWYTVKGYFIKINWLRNTTTCTVTSESEKWTILILSAYCRLKGLEIY